MEYIDKNSQKSLSPKLEVFAWTIVAGLVSGRIWIGIIIWIFSSSSFKFPSTGDANLVSYLFGLIPDFIFGAIVFLFPFIFRSIYGQYPFNFARHVSSTKKISKREIADFLSSSEESHLLSGQIIESKEIAQTLYNRSNMYLLFGSLIAIFGILYFSTTSRSISGSIVNAWPSYLQHTSELIIIELIAFFFLRQYRIAMEEYKYYESVKRQRESHLLIYKIIKSNLSNDQKESFFTKLNFTDPGKLLKDETTELIEGKKIPSEELNLLTKVLDTIKNLKQ